MRLTPIAALALLAAACAPTRQDFANRCAGYGFQPGTSDMARCIRDSENRYQDGTIQIIRDSQPPPPRSRSM
jgi:hypothetical protein